MSQNIPINKFEWMRDNSQYNEDSNKTYNKEGDEGHFLEVHAQYLKNYSKIAKHTWWIYDFYKDLLLIKIKKF